LNIYLNLIRVLLLGLGTGVGLYSDIGQVPTSSQWPQIQQQELN